MSRTHKEQWEDWKDCFAHRKILLTGHTGFKGGWLLFLLQKLGAQVIGISDCEEEHSISRCLNPIRSYFIDLRNREELEKIIASEKPECIVHLAAQSILSRGIQEPHLTFSTNIMSTVNVLDVALSYAPKAIVIASSDKVYRPSNSAHREDDVLGGTDPYSASKAASEHVVQAYQNLVDFPIATVRAGNVIGGGDFGQDRLVPDWIRAKRENRVLQVRNPNYVRPWLYVLDALFGYLLVLEHLYKKQPSKGEAWNIGSTENISVVQLIELLQKYWLIKKSRDVHHFEKNNVGFENQKEDPYLSLICSKAQQKLGWSKRFSIEDAVFWTIDGYKRQNSQAMNTVLEAYLD